MLWSVVSGLWSGQWSVPCAALKDLASSSGPAISKIYGPLIVLVKIQIHFFHS